MNIDRWFEKPGAYVLVDGQFGSTGKGLFAAYIAEQASTKPNWVTTNAGPNSGHTAYFNGAKIVTQQIPIASVVLRRLGVEARTLLNAGAIINPGRLAQEVSEYLGAHRPLIHPLAAVITAQHLEQDLETVRSVASTGKGVGPAIQEKIGRLNSAPTARECYLPILDQDRPSWDNFWDWSKDTVFVETAQGFSLGLNSVFYPNVTSRECTVMQAISDARIPAQMVQEVAMTVRCFPIRVGNTGASSGDGYGDQEETTWEAIGVEPEFTTVTKRVRRVFTWSREQFRDAVAANRPDTIFLNFLNYLDRREFPSFLQRLHDDYMAVMGSPRTARMYYGFGPLSTDIKRRWWDGNFRGET